MILAPARFAALLATPDPQLAGLLIAGEDEGRVALRRQDAVAAWLGPQGEAEMRLVRLAPADLRQDPARLTDALRERGFFPGPRVVLLEGAGDAQDEAVGAALAGWQKGDARLIVTAGDLRKKSSLRARFEAAPVLACLILRDQPPGPAEIEAELARSGLSAFEPGAREELVRQALRLEPGDLRQFLETVALYKWQDPAPLTLAEIAALTPLTVETAVEAVVAATAERRPGELPSLLRQIEGQGVGAATVAAAALRHFRLLFSLAPGGAGGGRGWGASEVTERQARNWGAERLGRALRLLVETDLALRSSPRAPAFAIVERALLRLAMAEPG